MIPYSDEGADVHSDSGLNRRIRLYDISKDVFGRGDVRTGVFMAVFNVNQVCRGNVINGLSFRTLCGRYSKVNHSKEKAISINTGRIARFIRHL